MSDTAEMTYGAQLRAKGLSFVAKPTPSKTIVDHTDTAVVRTTVKDESQDVHVVMSDCVRPHCPEMTKAHQDGLKEAR